MLLDAIVEPLVGWKALPVAQHPYARRAWPGAEGMLHPRDEWGGEVEIQDYALGRCTPDAVVHEQDVGRAGKVLTVDLLAERHACIELVVGQASLDEHVHGHRVGGKDGKAGLISLVSQLIVGDDADRIAADQPAVRADHRAHPVAQLGGLVLGRGVHDGQMTAAAVEPGHRLSGHCSAGFPGIRVVGEADAGSGRHRSPSVGKCRRRKARLSA